MKKIVFLVSCLVLVNLLYTVPGTSTQRVEFGPNVPGVTETLVFNKFNISNISGFNAITSITIQTSITVSGGFYAVDNDSPSGATVTVELGATASFPGSTADNNDLGVTTFPQISVINTESYGLIATTGDATDDYNNTGLDDHARYDGEEKTVEPINTVGSIYWPTYLGTGTFSVALTESQFSHHDGGTGVYYSGGPVTTEGWVEVVINYDYTLPVELSTFTAVFMDGTPTLQWMTQSESNNMGWNVYRADDDNFESSMQINYDIIPGAGTTSQPTNYEFEDGYPVIQGYTYFYWVESVDLDGTTEQHGPTSLEIPNEDNNQSTPDITAVEKFYNFPNPMNPDTWIYFDTQQSDHGQLTIFNIKGEKIKSLYSGDIHEGVNQFYWDGKDDNGMDVKSGVYLYMLKTGKRTYSQKMLLVK